MKKTTFIFIACLLFLSACSDEKTNNAAEPIDDYSEKMNVIKVESLEKLKKVLQPYHYSFNDWSGSKQGVPRLVFLGFTSEWNEKVSRTSVKNKKNIFFHLMLPLILSANEKILIEREIVETAALDSKKLINIALKYRVIKNKTELINNVKQKKLLKRVDIIPPSLALAQAAEESGWGTSRFVLEGNAFFGQWDFSGNGIKPKRQRKELGNYGIARFKSPLASVEGYMLNINTVSAYQNLRNLRAEKVKEHKSASGLLLAETLTKYSERGEAYVEGLRHLILYNKLGSTDDAYLSDNELVYLSF